MRYHVTARLKPGRAPALKTAIQRRTLGRGSVAGGEYLRNMAEARLMPNGELQWVEVCYCHTPLEEERPYWEAYFELLSVTDAHDRRACKHENGRDPWSCGDCTCTQTFERELQQQGASLLKNLIQGRSPTALDK